MKKTVFLSLCIWASAHMYGQTVSLTPATQKDSADGHIHKHQFLVGAFCNFSNSENTRTDALSGAVTGGGNLTLGGDVTMGFMLSRKVGLLLKGGYTESQPYTYEVVNGNNILLQDNDITYSVTPVMRYYKRLNDDNYFILIARFPVSFGQYTTQIYDTNLKAITSDTYNKFGLGAFLTPGFTSFLSKHIAAEIAIGSMGYSYLDGKDGAGNTTHTFNFDALLYLNSGSLGFVYYF